MMGYLHEGRQYVVVQVAGSGLPGSLAELPLRSPWVCILPTARTRAVAALLGQPGEAAGQDVPFWRTTDRSEGDAVQEGDDGL